MSPCCSQSRAEPCYPALTVPRLYAVVMPSYTRHNSHLSREQSTADTSCCRRRLPPPVPVPQRRTDCPALLPAHLIALQIHLGDGTKWATAPAVSHATVAYLGAWVAVQPGSDRLQLKASERLRGKWGCLCGPKSSVFVLWEQRCRVSHECCQNVPRPCKGRHCCVANARQTGPSPIRLQRDQLPGATIAESLAATLTS